MNRPSYFDEISGHPLIMMTEMVLETSVLYRQLTRLIAREGLIEFSRRESSRTHKPSYVSFWTIKVFFRL
jgi:hypothetical protein